MQFSYLSRHASVLHFQALPSYESVVQEWNQAVQESSISNADSLDNQGTTLDTSLPSAPPPDYSSVERGQTPLLEISQDSTLMHSPSIPQYSTSVLDPSVPSAPVFSTAVPSAPPPNYASVAMEQDPVPYNPQYSTSGSNPAVQYAPVSDFSQDTRPRRSGQTIEFNEETEETMV